MRSTLPRLRLWLALPLLAGLAGCELIARFDENRLDAGMDARRDTAVTDTNTGGDTSADAAADARMDAVVDAAADGG